MTAADDLLAEQKKALRASLRAARESLDRATHDRASADACARLLSVPELAGAARTVALFAATRSEVDVSTAARALFGAGACVVYPRVAQDCTPRLRFHVVLQLGALRPGRFGILEPPPELPEVAVEAIDVVVVPGLAFDRAGRRLGYGGGYYDEVGAILKARGRGVLVGVGFDFQFIENVPAGADDVAIDCVVTDARTVRCH